MDLCTKMYYFRVQYNTDLKDLIDETKHVYNAVIFVFKS